MIDLSSTVLGELRSANGKCFAEFNGPNESEFQFWLAGRRVLLLQLFRDGTVEMFRPVRDHNDMPTILDALRAYLHGAEEPG
jgi:hypothetical protein